VDELYRCFKGQVKRVKNWRSGPNPVARWAAFSLLETKKQFRTMNGFQQLPIPVEELKK